MNTMTQTSGDRIMTENSGPAKTPSLDVQSLAKSYRTGTETRQVLSDVTFDVQHGEFITIVGPSGAGKTTLLKCLSGLMRPDEGSVRLKGEEVTGPPAGLSVVFQDYSRSLLPWMSVLDNVRLPHRGTKTSRAEAVARAKDALVEVGLGESLHLYPWQMSGGMQQRAAIARGLTTRPELLLMDEPFASVDAQTRSDLEDLTLRLQRELGMTVVLVTHDIDEAVYLADRVIVLSGAPTSVTEIVDVDLGRDRDQVGTKLTPEFAQLRARVLSLVRH